MQADFLHSICKYIHNHILGHQLLFLKHYFSFITHVLCEFCSVFLCSTGLIATVCLCCPLLPPGKCIFKLYMSRINELILLCVYHVGICCVLLYVCLLRFGDLESEECTPWFWQISSCYQYSVSEKEWGQGGKLKRIFWLRSLEEYFTLRLNNAASFVLQEFFSFVILLFAANYILMSTN